MSEFGKHLSCRVSLCDGVDAKQARVGVRGVEGCGLKDSQRSSDIRKQTLWIQHTILFSFLYVFFKLTSKGCVVALAIPWLILLVMLEPLFTCGPAPRILCNTLKALASVLPVTPPSLAISAWTRLSLVCTRSSPTCRHTPTASL